LTADIYTHTDIEELKKAMDLIHLLSFFMELDGCELVASNISGCFTAFFSKIKNRQILANSGFSWRAQ